MKLFNQISNRYVKFLLTLSLISLIIYSCTDDDDDELYDYEDGVYYLELDGSPSQMGQRHGMAFKDEIRDSVEKYKQNVYKTFGKENGKLIIDWALNKAGFTKDLKEYLPHVYKEIQSLAKAVELPVEDILLINMDEEITQAAPVALGIKPEQNITPLATVMQVQREDDEKLCAQNINYANPNLKGRQLVIRYKYPNREILIYTFIGRVGGIGVSDKGLSVLAAKLPQCNKRKSDGLGVNYILRLLLELDDVENAVETLKKIPKFVPYSYAIADYKQSVITEESGDQFLSSPMLQYPGYQCHTNHMLWIEPKEVPDIPGIFERCEPLPDKESFFTIERLEQAKAALSGDLHEIHDDELEELLTRPKINSTIDEYKTLQSAIIKYDEDDIDLIVSAGSDPERDWSSYDF
ncbi:MAG: C45 family peptidase [Phycisphaerae bacterium]|nr:C45 family peptidase [Phycisphaerae bacterium]